MTSSMTSERLEWPAMGTRARLLLVGGDASVASMVPDVVADLEARWSRFRPDSELCRLNRAAGHPTVVSSLTAALIADAASWWHATGGRFDPTVLPAVQAAGYDRSFELGPGATGPGAPAPGCDSIQADPVTGVVRLPAGVSLDLGGIGKGRAVDLVTEALRPVVAGGLVELGGDLRVWGEPPDEHGWRVGVEDLRAGRTHAILRLGEGAVATSSVLRRRWMVDGAIRHHLIDPGTGEPTAGELVSVTVAAGRAEGCDVLAKAALVAGTMSSAARLLRSHGVSGWLVPRRGAPVSVGGVDELVEAA